jgi:predicted transcriptional regulator of viral defense system
MLVFDLIVAVGATILLVMNTDDAGLGTIVDTLRLKAHLGDVSDKRGKIARMINACELIQLRRGLYATRNDIDPFCLAASIYGPSYISFETALSFYGLIPEAVTEISSATLKRPKEFENAFGRYRYRSVPRGVYAFGIERIADSSVPFLIASPTKALCDRIALEPRMRSMSDVRKWVTLMRLDSEVELDPAVLEDCAESYRRPAVRFLRRTVERYGGLPSYE